MPARSAIARVRLLGALGLLAVLGVGVYWYMQTTDHPLDRIAVQGWRLAYWAVPIEDTAGLRTLHENAVEESRAQCVACHGDKTSSKLPLHRIHLRSTLLTGLACHECHQRVELATRDNRTMVTWVDVGFCKKCHSDFPGEHAGSKMRPADYEADCLKCHSGKQAVKHEAHYLPRDIPEGECKGCHGGRALPWTPRHEAEDWLQTHGDEALETGTEDCFQCHDFGLKFCDDCHGTKPPSHTPAERWLGTHVEAARADTRVCYTCHRTSFCKKCHLNHEDGWMQNHPAFVRDSGDTSCRECHSSSACGYCHTAVAAEAL